LDAFQQNFNTEFIEVHPSIKIGVQLQSVISELQSAIEDLNAYAGNLDLVDPTKLPAEKTSEYLMQGSAEKFERTESQRTFRELDAVFEALTDPAILYNSVGVPVRANPAAIEVLGFDLTGMDRSLLFKTIQLRSPDGKLLQDDEIPSSRALRGEVVKGERLILLNQHGIERAILASASPYYDDHDQLAGSVLILHDISELDRSEREKTALYVENNRQREILERLVREAPIGICILEGPKHSFSMVNPAFESLLNGRTDLVGQPFGEVWPEANQELIPLFDRAYQTGIQLSAVKLQIERPDRLERRTLLINTAPIQAIEGQPAGIIGVFQDTTEREVMEKEIQQRAFRIEIQHRLADQREKERVRIARDLHNGPLQDLIALAFYLQDVRDIANDEAIQEKLLLLQTEIQKQIRNLRDFSAGMRPPMLSHFKLGVVLQSYVETMAQMYPELEIQLEIHQEDKMLSEWVRTILFRIFQEMLDNVVRHSQAKAVRVRLVIDESPALLEVEDNGKGFLVPVEWLDLVRTGHLGLAGIQERVEAIGGKIEIESIKGKGTHLLVEVPF
jgi:PAS domain S-box-containing protein